MSSLRGRVVGVRRHGGTLRAWLPVQFQEEWQENPRRESPSGGGISGVATLNRHDDDRQQDPAWLVVRKRGPSSCNNGHHGLK